MTNTNPVTPAAASESRYINRELSWLAFNERVLEEAANISLPLLERLKFLAISASNLDEFFSVRVAALEAQKRHQANRRSIDGLAPEEQIAAILDKVGFLATEQENYWQAIETLLSEQDIFLLNQRALTKDDRQWLAEWFSAHCQPQLTTEWLGLPEASDHKPVAPHRLNAFVTLIPASDRRKRLHAIIRQPKGSKRFLELPPQGRDAPQVKRIILAEDAISLFLHELFPDHAIEDAFWFRILRDSWLNISEEAEDLISTFRSALKKREKNRVLRVEMQRKTPENIRKYLQQHFSLKPYQVVSVSGMLGFRDIMELYELDRPNMKFNPMHIRFPERIDDFSGDCLAAIAAKDIIVHHPYESFDVVVQFLRQAARDPKVTAIKQTLYRTSRDSPIVHALIQAAKAGKQVTVMVELKARFDEEANLQWGLDLEQAGARVIYGLPGYKTHGKISLVERVDNDEIVRYAHFGTGNYHPANARIYSDLSFFTCNSDLCGDVHALFAFFEGTISKDALLKNLKKVCISPYTLRQTLVQLVEEEIAHAQKGKPANIWIKVNSLNDPLLIDALYRASQAGVSVELVVRGICCLRPGVPGQSENIRVKSIVGRFLEHTRIYCFGAGHRMPHRKARVFISSADAMPRNMEKRIECLVPIENPTVHEQVLDQIMVANLRDAKQSWVLARDGAYHRTSYRDDSFSAHDFFMANPSLSGRGSALRKLDTPHEPEIPAGEKGCIAVIDIGSNSVRMVIYDGLKRRSYPLYNEKTLCGLARGLAQTGKLNEEGVRESLKALIRYTRIIDAMRINTIYCFATSAVRDASDGRLFIKTVEQQCNLDVQILSGEEEARLAAMGIASAYYEADGVVGDLGGGSLELASLQAVAELKITQEYMHNHIAIDHLASFPLGSLRVGDEALETIDAIRARIAESLSSYPLPSLLRGKSFYAVGGGFRALAKMHLIATEHPVRVIEHHTIPADDMMNHLDIILRTPKEKLNTISALAGISEKRLDMLHNTSLVLEQVIKIGRPSLIRFSTHGVREGLLYDQLDLSQQTEDPLRSGVCNMLHLLSPNMGKVWVQFGQELYSWTNPLFTDETYHMTRLRFAASILNNIAWHEHTSLRAESSFRWVLDSELSGIDHWERVFIACAVYHRYKYEMDREFLRVSQQILDGKWQQRAKQVGLAMRFGIQLSGGACNILPRTQLKVSNKVIELTCHKDDKPLITESVSKRFIRLCDAMNLVPRIV